MSSNCNCYQVLKIKIFSIVNVMGINNRMYLTIIPFNLILSLLCEIYDTCCLLTTSKIVSTLGFNHSYAIKWIKMFFNDKKELVLSKATLNNTSYQSKVVFQ